jgi:hypothetical protein
MVAVLPTLCTDLIPMTAWQGEGCSGRQNYTGRLRCESQITTVEQQHSELSITEPSMGKY